MADEITYQVYLKLVNGNRKPGWAIAAQTVDQTGTDYNWTTQTISNAAAEALALGDIGTPGMMMLHNLGANYIEIGYDDTGFKPTVKVLAGEYSLFRHAQAAPQALANTAPVEIQFLLLEA